MSDITPGKLYRSNIVNVCAAGDLHGDYKSFRSILTLFDKYGRDSLLIFLGDYADRGLHGVEIITELNHLLDKRENIVALKGNHEIYIGGLPLFSHCSLIYEAEHKYGSWNKFYNDIMIKFLSKLYIAATINDILFVHGGISSEIKTADDLTQTGNESDLLWSDPSATIQGEILNPRGTGVLFGEDVAEKVLSSLGQKMIVRSHEPRKAANGPYPEHGGKVVTINSCSLYGKPFLLKINTISLEYEPLFQG